MGTRRDRFASGALMRNDMRIACQRRRKISRGVIPVGTHPSYQEEQMHTVGRPKIVILGAGFAGIYTAQALGKLLPHAVDAEITVIDENNFFVFTPMLTEVAGGDLDPRHIVCAIRRFSPRINFIQGRVTNIDLKRKRVTVSLGRPEEAIPDGQASLVAGRR